MKPRFVSTLVTAGLLALSCGVLSAIPAAPTATNPNPSYADSLASLQSLNQRGVLTDAEYAAAHQRLLSTTVFSLHEVDVLPKPVRGYTLPLPSPQPSTQPIVLRFVVGADGRVSGVRAIMGETALPDGWKSYVSQWRWVPGEKEGTPVSTEVRVALWIPQRQSTAPRVQDPIANSIQ